MSKILLEKLSRHLNTGILFQMVDECLCMSHLLKKLGYSEKMHKYALPIKQFLVDSDIDFSHWTNNGLPRATVYKKVCINCGEEFTVTGEKKKNQKTCSYKCAAQKYRTGEAHPNYTNGISSYRPTAFNHYGKCCNICGFSDERALEVHHIDKDRNNNSISNLRVLCGNCHIITHKG